MPWLVLILSGALEAVWATALSRSDGLTRPLPAAIFGVAVVVSMFGLGYAMRFLPPGTSYAVWVGVGAALTVAVAMAGGAEAVSFAKIALLTGLIGCVVGLQLVSR